jgi:hypothetical protein
MTTTLETPEETTETIETQEDAEVGKELATIETEPEGIAEPKPLTPTKAQQLDKRIRTQGQKVDDNADTFIDLLEKAALGQIHVGLEQKSWPAYVADVAQDNKFLQMLVKDKLQRKALAAKMSGTGMSQGAIAKAFGVSQKTIDRDLDGEEFDSDTITTTDGHSYPRNRNNGKVDDAEVIDAEVVDDESPAKPPTVDKDFETEVFNITNDIAALQDVIGDERFPKARKRIMNKHLNALQEAKAELEEIIDGVFGE